MLYEVLLHEIGHLQVVEATARNARRKFADEKYAVDFAQEWRATLWAGDKDRVDSSHHPPSAEELSRLDAGWLAAVRDGEVAERLWRSKEYAEACRHDSRALDAYPDHDQALHRLGRAFLFGLGVERAPKRAVELLGRCVHLDPLNDWARFRLALALAEVGLFDEAEHQFARSSPLISWPDGQRRFASRLVDAGRIEVAVRILRKLLRAAPDDEASIRLLSEIVPTRRGMFPGRL
jgi:tetratricopeptide (TPR) repeat protein